MGTEIKAVSHPHVCDTIWETKTHLLICSVVLRRGGDLESTLTSVWIQVRRTSSSSGCKHRLTPINTDERKENTELDRTVGDPTTRWKFAWSRFGVSWWQFWDGFLLPVQWPWKDGKSARSGVWGAPPSSRWPGTGPACGDPVSQTQQLWATATTSPCCGLCRVR